MRSSNSTKKRTVATTTTEGKCVLVRAFIRNYRWPLSGIIRLSRALPCVSVRSCEFLGVTVCSHVFTLHPNWPLSDIIHNHVRSCAFTMALNWPLL